MEDVTNFEDYEKGKVEVKKIEDINSIKKNFGIKSYSNIFSEFVN